MKKISRMFTIVSLIIMMLSFVGCSSNDIEDEPVYSGEYNNVAYYKIKYPEGMGLEELFGAPLPEYQMSCPVSVYEPNNIMIVKGTNYTGKGIIYGGKDFFIVYCDELSSTSFEHLGGMMIGENAMEYSEGEQYIKDILL